MARGFPLTATATAVNGSNSDQLKRGIKLVKLLKHGAFVAGDQDITLPIHPIAIMSDPSLFNLEPGRGNAVHTGFVGFGSCFLLVGDRDILLKFVPLLRNRDYVLKLCLKAARN